MVDNVCFEGDAERGPLFGVPAREAAAEDGLVGEMDPPLWERCEEGPPSLVGETDVAALDDGMFWSVAAVQVAERCRKSTMLPLVSTPCCCPQVPLTASQEGGIRFCQRTNLRKGTIRSVQAYRGG